MSQQPWMTFAWADLGVAEFPGSRSNPRVMDYYRLAGNSGIGDDAVPWCAAFVGACLERAHVTCSRSLAARSYLSWGKALDQPEPGCIVVLSRGQDPSAGHVGFLAGVTASKVFLLGGNQGDAVSVASFERGRVLGYRLPATSILPNGAGERDDTDPPPVSLAASSDDEAFAVALAAVLEFEGGYTDDPFDPGGATNKGITIAEFARAKGVSLDPSTAPSLKAGLRDIPDTLVRAIYFADYWQAASCPSLSPGLSLFHFDAAVNQGVGTAARMLQQALGVEADGEIGPLTLAAARDSNSAEVLARYAGIRRVRYRSLSTFWRFGRGWLRRTDEALAKALAVARPPAASGPSSGTAAATTTEPPPSSQPDGAPPMSTSAPPEAPADPNSSLPSPAIQPEPAKWWGQSVTIWGALITAFSTVAPAIFAVLGFDVSPDLADRLGHDILAVIQAVGGLVGTALTIIGRVRATSPIGRRALSVRL